MGLQLIDDFSGKPLERDHEPIVVRIGSEGWNLYLTDDSKEALFKALEPFTATAEPIQAVRPSTSKVSNTKAVREWAIANNVKNIKADGSQSPVGDRGILAQNVYDAYAEYQKTL